MWLYFLGAFGCTIVFWVWYEFLRVPQHLKRLPVIPSPFATQAERIRVTRELAKTHAVARMWLMRWTLVVLHPELAKIVENNAQLYEKAQDGLNKRAFFVRFIGPRWNVVRVQTEDWKRHRAVINPAFDHKFSRDFTDVFNQVAEKLITELSKVAPSTSVHPHDWVQRYTLDCLGLALFGFDFGSVQNPQNETASVYHRLTDDDQGGVFGNVRLLIPFGLYDLLPTPGNRALSKDLDAWERILDKMMKLGETHAHANDLAAQFVKASQPGAQNHLSMQEVKSDIAIFFVAGHETSAISVASTMWYLARYPEIQERVYNEILSVVGSNEEPTFDTQKGLEYLSQVIYEANRLNPPVRILARRIVTQDTELGGIKLKKGSRVAVSIESLHHLEREWPNPDEFNPDRFQTDVRRHPSSWQPFGGGPRVCLGKQFSLIEQRVVLVKILQKFRLAIPDGASQDLEIADKPGLLRVKSVLNLLPRR